jgi:hypothetical protein
LLSKYRGQPTIDCVTAVENYVTKEAVMMEALAFTLGCLLLLGVVGSLIMICCIKSRARIKSITNYKYEILDENII